MTGWRHLAKGQTAPITLSGPLTRHVGRVSACQCACGASLVVHDGYSEDFRPNSYVGLAVKRHRRTPQHLRWLWSGGMG